MIIKRGTDGATYRMKKIAGEREGFTIVETIISLAVFSVLVSVAMGGLATAMRTQRQTTALIMVNSNIPFALEQMAREMRTGIDFY
ncbi:MAG: hypothetical protein RL681_500, partial [Candidatus Parcubacteria bacterium]